MPFVEITLTEGRSRAQLTAAAAAATEAIATALEVDPATVRVVVREVPEDLWFVGGRPLPEVRADRAKAKAGK